MTEQSEHLDKAQEKPQEPEFGAYQVGEKTYRLAPFTVHRLEQVGALLAGIPVEDLLNAYWEIEAKIEQARQRAKDQEGEGARLPRPDEPGTDIEAVLTEVDVDVSITNIIIALQKALPVIGNQGILVKFVAVALDIEEQEAADLPAGVALEVVPDFFTANKGLFKTSLRSSLPGMILARQVTTPPSAESPDMPSTASPPHPTYETP